MSDHYHPFSRKCFLPSNLSFTFHVTQSLTMNPPSFMTTSAGFLGWFHLTSCNCFVVKNLWSVWTYRTVTMCIIWSHDFCLQASNYGKAPWSCSQFHRFTLFTVQCLDTVYGSYPDVPFHCPVLWLDNCPDVLLPFYSPVPRHRSRH